MKPKTKDVLSALKALAGSLRASEPQGKRTAYEAIPDFITQNLAELKKRGQLSWYLGLMLLRDALAATAFKSLSGHHADAIEQAVQMLSDPNLQLIDLREIWRHLQEFGFTNPRGIEAYSIRRGPSAKPVASARMP